MRVLVVTHSYGQNGAATIMKAVLSYWAKSKGWTIWARVAGKTPAPVRQELRDLGIVPIESMEGLGKVDFVLVNTLIDYRLVDHFYGKVPIAFWIHEGTSALGSWPGTPRQMIETMSRANLLMFDSGWQSECVFKSFIHHLPAERIKVVSCAIEDVPPWPCEQPDPLTDRYEIVCIGTVYGRKRQLDLAKAIVNLSSTYPIHCTFIGDLAASETLGPQVHQYLTQFPEQLTWTGQIDAHQKHELICRSNLGCFPSGDETFGLAQVEFAAYQKPVIMAALPVYQYIGWRHGVNCLMFQAGHVGQIERAIERLMQDQALAGKLAKGGYALSQQFRMPPFLDRITDVIVQAFGR